MQIVVVKLIPCVWPHGLAHSGVVAWLLWYYRMTTARFPAGSELALSAPPSHLIRD